jgi:hypothetical protein
MLSSAITGDMSDKVEYQKGVQGFRNLEGWLCCRAKIMH